MSGAAGGPGGSEPPELDVLAGEYVLGTLSAEEMRVVRRQAAGDPALLAAIRRWEGDLLPLSELIPALAPPEALWARIAVAIAPVPMDAANDAEPTTPATRVLNAPPRAPRPPPRKVWPWQLSTAAAVALAAGLAVFAFTPQPATAPARIATIGPVGAPPPAFLADASADGRVVLTALSPADVPGGRDLELWVLPAGAQHVASLGVLPATGRAIMLPSLPASGTQLLISLEPQGGSPTGQPTGPVLYAGTLSAH